jgi:DNA helicase-2/ATP-dependent DNA helicase PcrA
MSGTTTTATQTPWAAGAWTLDDTIALLGEGRPDWSLTAQQRAAVGAPLEPGLIVAGAGSGKTEVMAARVVHLVATGQVRPDEVLGLTFTTKATASLAARVRSGLDRLRERLRDHFGPSAAGSPGWDGEPAVLTYNGYGARLVADHGLRIGIEPAARLAPEGLRWQLALTVVRRWSEPLDVDLTPATVAERVRQLADEMSSHLADPADVIAAVAAMETMLDTAPKIGAKAEEARVAGRTRLALLRLVEAFVQAKRDGLLLDYGDQVALAARLAGQTVVAVAERTAHRVVLLDEYQDTGVAQRLLLQRLFGQGHPVTAVGDPAQSIYGFRGASVGNILNFPRHFPRCVGSQEEPARQYPLNVNFRSGGAILDVANVIVKGLDTAFGAGRVPPTVLEPREGRETGGSDGGEVRAAMLADAISEADWVADLLKARCEERRHAHPEHCADEGCQGWHEAAVLCRRRSQFGLLRQALERRGVPVEVIGLGGLLDAPEVADLVAVLRVLHDATANAAVVRLITGPRWRIGLRDLDALGRRAAVLVRDPHPSADAQEPMPLRLGGDEAEVGSLSDALEALDDPALARLAPLSPEALARLRRLRGELASLRRRLDQPLPDLVADIERTIGLDIELEATPDRLRQGRRANVLAFLDVAADFVGLDGQTDLGAFLASLDAAEKAEDGYDLGVPSAADTVKLMTVHAAKGLEWDIVAVPGLSKGVFPSNRGTSPWPWRPEALPGSLRGDRDDLPVWTDPSPAGCTSYREATKAVLATEERRLAYVAVTRAREVLICSGFWWSATASKPLIPRSDFFAEIEAACREGAGIIEPEAPEPVAGEENPLLAADRVPDIQWPPAPVVPDGTRWAAAAVRRRAESGDEGEDGEQELPGDLTPEELERIAGWQKDAQLLLAERRAGKGRREVALPNTLAVSDLVDLATDADRFAARVARPLPAPPAPAARRGSTFHAWLEQRSASRALIGPDELPGSSDPEPVVSDADLEALKAGFLSTSWAAVEPVAVEVAFELVLDGTLVRGRIDAVYRRDDGGYDVIDYKTGARPAGSAARAAAVQLACYRLAWADIAQVKPEQVAAGFLYVRDGEDGLVRPTLPSREELARLLVEPETGDGG